MSKKNVDDEFIEKKLKIIKEVKKIKIYSSIIFQSWF